MLEHQGRGHAACSGEAVAAHWVEVLDVEASVPGSSGVMLESSVAASKTKGATLALASAASSSVVV
jgi:hypothetical protein